MIKTLSILSLIFLTSAKIHCQKTSNGKIKQILSILNKRSVEADNAGYRIISLIANNDISSKLEITPIGDSLYIEGYAMLDSKIGFMDGDGLKLYRRRIEIGKKEQPIDSFFAGSTNFTKLKSIPNSNIYLWKLALDKSEYPHQSSISEIINLAIRFSVIPVGVPDAGIGKSPSDFWCFGIISYYRP